MHLRYGVGHGTRDHRYAVALECLGRGLVADDDAVARGYVVDGGAVEVVVMRVCHQHNVRLGQTRVWCVFGHGVDVYVLARHLDGQRCVLEEGEGDDGAVGCGDGVGGVGVAAAAAAAREE